MQVYFLVGLLLQGSRLASRQAGRLAGGSDATRPASLMLPFRLVGDAKLGSGFSGELTRVGAPIPRCSDHSHNADYGELPSSWSVIQLFAVGTLPGLRGCANAGLSQLTPSS